MRLRSGVVASAGTMAILFAAVSASGQTVFNWTGAGGDNNWGTDGNWDQPGYPNGLDHDAIIDGNATVLLNLGGNRNVRMFSIAAGSTLAPDSSDNRILRPHGGTANPSVNAGTISSNMGGEFRLYGGSGTRLILTNSGVIEASGENSILSIYADSGQEARIDNRGGTFRTVGASTLSFGGPSGGVAENTYIQGGTIINNPEGTVVVGRRLVLGAIDNNNQGDPTVFENAGTFNYTSPTNFGASSYGAGLGLVVRGTSTFNNTGTTNFVRMVSGAEANNRAAVLNVGGTATLTNTGTINIITQGDATESNPNAAAHLQLGSLTAQNNGTINIESRSTTGTTQLIVSSNAAATLDGNGEVVLTVGAGGAIGRVGIGGGNASSSLTNSATHTIRGAGLIGLNTLNTLVNNGTIHADNTLPLIFDPRDTGGTFTNNGLIRASGTGGMTFREGNHINSASGTYQIDLGSSLTIDSDASVTVAGTLTGAGTVVGLLTLENGATLNPTGVFTLDDVSIASGAEVNVDFTLGTDQIDLTGVLAGDGSFLFDFGGTGQANQTYTLLTFESIEGLSLDNFSYINLAADLEGSYLELTSNALQLVTVPEPSSALLALGLGSLFLRRRRI